MTQMFPLSAKVNRSITPEQKIDEVRNWTWSSFYDLMYKFQVHVIEPNPNAAIQMDVCTYDQTWVKLNVPYTSQYS
jgi:hypothetical protein